MANGAEEFAKLARDLRAAGDKDLRKELYRGLNRATKGLKDAAKDSARRTLPQGGGLADRVARARFSTRARAGRSPSIRIVAKDSKGRPVDLYALDQGTVRHPTFGRRPWVAQRVDPGWFTEPMERGAGDARRHIEAAVAEVARKFNAG